MSAPVVEMRNIEKRFGSVRALRGVNLTVYPGEVVGLVGDNGAGKSTLMKILTGVEQPDGGEILLEGKPVRFENPRASRMMGVEMVYQDLALAGNLSVAENIFLGREIRRGLFLDDAEMEALARRYLDQLSIHIPNVRTPVEQLSGGQRQCVAVARAVAFQAKVVIMDEPTAALAVMEAEKVLDVVRTLRSQGVAVILITHRLQDVLQTADRVVVLCQGQNAGELPAADATIEDIILRMVGGEGKRR